nr:immunoglobulin light chain junction region [Macaca mulatta]
CQHYYNIPYSF